MIEFSRIIRKWLEDGQQIMLTRVIKTWGSSPRPIGSIMLNNTDGNILGSISGGCVEGAVVKSAIEALGVNESRVLHFGVTDEDAWSVGLSCGGNLEVFMQPVQFKKGGVWDKLLENLKHNKSSIVISGLDKETSTNTILTEGKDLLGDPLPIKIKNEALKAFHERVNRVITHDGQSYFIHVFPRKHLLIMVGAAHITVDLVELANNYGFETVVIDPRGFFVENTIFNSQPNHLLQSFPSEVLGQFPLDAYTFCAILSHDPKIDDNALEILLPSDTAYIGALGSKKTHAKRVARLKEKGIANELIEKIKAPIGMPIKAKSAKEIALAVMGEIILAKNQFK